MTFDDLLCEEFYESVKGVKVITPKKLSIRGEHRTTGTWHKFLRPVLLDTISGYAPKLYIELTRLNAQGQSATLEPICDGLVEWLYPPSEEEEVEIDTDLALAVDLVTGRDVLYRRSTMQTTIWNPQSYIRTVGKDERKFLEAGIIPCRLSFDPQNLNSHWRVDTDIGGVKEPITHFNEFVAPPFRFLKAGTPRTLGEIDPDLSAYFHALSSNNPDTLHILLSWLKTAVMGRSRTIMVLVGQGGTGKSFYGKLLGHLVGYERYFTPAQNEFFESRFVSQLGVKRAILVDEGDMPTTASVNNAKKYVELHFSSERKGEEAEAMKPIHASLVVTNNNYDRMKLRPEERKFTVPDVAEIKMRDVFKDVAAWEDFVQRIVKDETLILIYNFLKSYETDWTAYTDYRGETFWRMVIEGGLSDREKAVYDAIQDLEEDIDITEFVRSCNRGKEKAGYRVTRKSVEKLLKEFESGGKVLGEIHDERLHPLNTHSKDEVFDDDDLDEFDLL